MMVFAGGLSAQTQHQNTGWGMWLNNTMINKKWGLYFDTQVRSSDGWTNVRNFLFRPGITYYANSKNEYTLGYLLNQTYTHAEEPLEHVLTEHRIWEQYVHRHKISRIIAMHRFRLEQRFTERQSADQLFTQRFRYFARFIIPFTKPSTSFEKGPFAAVQNELFFNIQNKDQLNNSLFDQNRLYLAGGYRINKHVDLEAGYLNQAIKGSNNNTSNNVVQIAVYTKF